MTELTTQSQIFSVSKSLFLVLIIFFVCVAIYSIARRKWNNCAFAKEPKQLVIKESLILDTKRRLVRIQNRHYEHLLLLGSSHDLIIESYPIKAQTKLKENNHLENMKI